MARASARIAGARVSRTEDSEMGWLIAIALCQLVVLVYIAVLVGDMLTARDAARLADVQNARLLQHFAGLEDEIRRLQRPNIDLQ